MLLKIFSSKGCGGGLFFVLFSKSNQKRLHTNKRNLVHKNTDLFDFQIQKIVDPLAGNANGEEVPYIPTLRLARTCTAL